MTSPFVQGTSLDNRVEDYLDDKLQSTTDLDSLDELLANVELQRNQLQSQLDSAVQQLDEARRTADGKQGAIEAQIEEFQQLQDSIDTREQIASVSDAPDQAIARLQPPLEVLRAVERAKKFLELVRDVEMLRKEARAHLPDSPKAALEPYTKLKQLASRLKKLQGDETLHLVDYVGGVTEALWSDMKRTMSEEFEGVLNARGWPKVDPESQMDDEWVAAFEKLVDLQIPELVYSPEPVSLLPLEAMSKIFVLEFRFHFLSDKPTSNPRAVGTYCFPWIVMRIEKWEDFLRDNLGHLLAEKFRDTPVANDLLYVDPVCAFITSLLPVIREKVFDVASKAKDKPAFLSNFVNQVMSLDEKLASRFNYDGGTPESGWRGLTTDILDEYFDIWFNAERDFAMDRFEKIMEASDGRKIDYEYAVDGRMKPTYAAVRVTDLLRSRTLRYSRLRRVRHKIQFLIHIQIDILEEYDGRLRGSLQAYLTITSAIGRALHGATKEELAALEGTGGLESLCRILGSADHMVNTLKDWSTEEFFLELWDQLQAGPPSTKQRAGRMSFDEVKNRTSTAMGGSEDGGVFDEMITAYKLRRKAAHDMLVSALRESHWKPFRIYGSRVQFTIFGDLSVLDDAYAISPELDEPLYILKRNLDFLSRALSTATFRRVWREALDQLEDQLWDNVLLHKSFTTFGATQFLRDGEAIFALVDRYIPSGSSAMSILHDGMRLLCLPVEAEGEDEVMTLKEASDRVYQDNDEARKVLEELQLSELTPQNARYILSQRVENSENVEW